MKSASDNSIPRRALVIDSDPSLRESTAALLKLQGFDVIEASDAPAALTEFARDWYPLVLTNRNIPLLDGIEIASRLRVVALAPVYILMLTDSTDARDHELGYCSGVDQFLHMANYAAELPAKAEAGVVALRRRREARTGRAGEPATVDLESGAHTARHLVGRLHAEIAHARRNNGRLQVLSIGIDTDDGAAFARLNRATSVSNALLPAVHDAIRPRLDWVTRLPSPPHTCRLAVIMPDSSLMDAAKVEQRIRNAFAHWNTESPGSDVRLSCGLATLTMDSLAPTALEFLGQAERSRRGKDTSRTGIFAIHRENAA